MGGYRERFEVARTQFRLALTRLHEALDEDESSFIRDALIQRFEFTYELAWKAMFYWLRDIGEQVPRMVRPVLDAAFRGGLIVDAGIWEKIKEYRDLTSHTYDESKAVAVAAFVRSLAVTALDDFNVRVSSL